MTAIADRAPVRRRAGHGARAQTLAFSISLLLLFLAPLGYRLALIRVSELHVLGDDQLRHLLLNWACNIVALLTAWQAKGAGRVRFAKASYALLIGHGLLAFVILATRDYYYRPLMLSAATVSVLLCGLALMSRSRLQRRRVAAIGETQGDIGVWIRSIADVIDDPATDLRKYDVVTLNLTDELPAKWASPIARAMLAGCEVRHVAEYLEERRGRVSIDHFNLDHVAERGPVYNVLKRFLDVSLALLLLPIGGAILLLAVTASLVVMGRPILFVQTRIGLGGRPFRIYKLRTMRIQTEAERSAAGVMSTSSDDPRITPLGGFLRRFRIDELPQLWNVIKGDMSLVGPRPEMPVSNAAYIQQVPAFAFRLLVRPGITGWAQVRAGYAGNLEEAKVKLSYDLYYVKNISLVLDLQVMARTVWTLLSGSGAR